MRRWLAGLLDPEARKLAEAHRFMRMKLDEGHMWLGSDFPVAAHTLQWALDADANYRRSLDDAPIGNLPSDISQFREWLRQRFPKPSPVEGDRR